MRNQDIRRRESEDETMGRGEERRKQVRSNLVAHCSSVSTNGNRSGDLSRPISIAAKIFSRRFFPLKLRFQHRGKFLSVEAGGTKCSHLSKSVSGGHAVRSMVLSSCPVLVASPHSFGVLDAKAKLFHRIASISDLVS